MRRCQLVDRPIQVLRGVACSPHENSNASQPLQESSLPGGDYQPTRQREQRMQGFKSPSQAQRFLSAYGPIMQHFRPRRHLFSPLHTGKRCGKDSELGRTSRASQLRYKGCDRGRHVLSCQRGTLTCNKLTRPSWTLDGRDHAEGRSITKTLSRWRGLAQGTNREAANPPPYRNRWTVVDRENGPGSAVYSTSPKRAVMYPRRIGRRWT